MPNTLPGYQNVEDDELRAEVEFLVVQDIFPTDTVAYADVVLPATSWAERGGTVANTDRRVQLMRGIGTVYEGTKHDLDILAEVGTRLFGADGGFDFDGPEAVFEELRQVCPIYYGMTYDLLGTEGIHWPCLEPGDEGDPYLCEDVFTTPNGMGHIEGVRHQPPKEVPDDEYPLILTTARLIEHYNTGTMSRRSPTLNRQHPENFVDVHPADAERYGVADGDTVTLRSRRGEIEMRGQVTEDIKEGTVWTTPHFTVSSANRLTNDVLDERAKLPEYKAAAVAIEGGSGSTAADD
jgi:predicted molibdopterin-dependent oxidoreductase YjgC